MIYQSKSSRDATRADTSMAPSELQLSQLYYQKCHWGNLSMVCLVSVLLLFLGFSVPAEAGMVSGRVFLNDKPLQNQTFTLESGQFRVNVQTDNDGRFSISIAPGTYTVKFPGSENQILKSYPEPLQRDIYLKRGQ